MYKKIETPREAVVMAPGTKVSMEEIKGKIVVCDDSFPISLACEASSVIVGGREVRGAPMEGSHGAQAPARIHGGSDGFGLGGCLGLVGAPSRD